MIIGRKSIPEFRTLLSLVEHHVFSPVPKALSSVFMEEDSERAYELLHGAGFSDGDIMVLIAGEEE